MMIRLECNEQFGLHVGCNVQGQLGVGDGSDGANMPVLPQVVALNENAQPA